MRIVNWTFDDVAPDGRRKGENGKRDQQLSITPSITRSYDDGGCGDRNCGCDKSWEIVINMGFNRKTKSISGLTILFDSQEEFMEYIISGTPAIATSQLSYNPN